MPTRTAYRAARRLLTHDSDGLSMFRSMPSQMPIVESRASELVCRGGNRSGKTIICATKFASVARDKPIIGYDGKEYDQRLPWQKNRPLLMWCVGLSWKHIGDTLWRVLFRSGLYHIIRDEYTNMWRAFDPNKDKHRLAERRPSFPLIPMSAVKGGMKGISWANAKERQFSRIELLNGTVIMAFASTGEVKAGDPVDYIWVDEEIARIGHYDEWQARLSDTKGRIVWSSLAYSNPALMSVSKRAAEQRQEVVNGERKRADVEEYLLKFSANPFIDSDEKRKRLEGWDEDTRKMRDEGEYVVGNLRVYPLFDRYIHCAYQERSDGDDNLATILRRRNGEPPENWTRELILDPGTSKPAVLLCAIPPKTDDLDGKQVELWNGDEPFYVVYDEIYIPRLDAGALADKIAEKTKGWFFQRFIIDGQAAQQTPMGFAGTVGGNYTKEFQKRHLRSVETGSGFLPGDPNWSTRSQLVDASLRFRITGRPQLRIVIDRCRNLVEQLEGNLKKTGQGPSGEVIVLDEPAPRQKDDCRVCLEYWLSRRPKYVAPIPVQYDGGGGMLVYKKLLERYARNPEPKVIKIGPGSAA